jgi:hypothetical protein
MWPRPIDGGDRYRALCVRGVGVHVLIGTIIALVAIAVGIWISRASHEPSGNDHLDAYRAKFVLKGRALIGLGVAIFIASVLVQTGVVGPN